MASSSGSSAERNERADRNERDRDELFDGTTDFDEWLTNIKLKLKQNGVDHVLHENEPTDPPKIRDFKNKQDVARRIILESVTDDVLVMLRYKNSPKEIINELSARNKLKGGLRLSIAQELFRSLLYLNDRPLAQYFDLFEKLASNVRAAGAPVDEDDMIGQLLVTMPPEYDNTVAALDVLYHRDKTSISYELCKDTLLAEEERLVLETGEELGTTNFIFYPFH